MKTKSFIKQYRDTNYYVSTDGEVFSKITHKQLKPIRKSNGYYKINIYVEKYKFIQPYIHRMVAETFLDDYSNDLTVNHIDENKSNNKLSNLEMTTLKENLDKYYTGKKSKVLLIKNNKTKVFNSIYETCKHFNISFLDFMSRNTIKGYKINIIKNG